MKVCLLLPLLLMLAACTAPTSDAETAPEDAESAQPSYRYDGKPLRVGVVGLVHTHVHWILGREDLGDIEIVGIAEPNRELAQRYSEQHGYDMALVYDGLEEMVAATQPEAVLAFNTIYDHLATVQYCAPRGIHVMVEKPLAVSLDHAQQMLALAREHGIHLLTNYETTWYGSTHEAFRQIQEPSRIGELRRLIFYTGHPGPVEIGCNQEFLDWLTDPALNGGGALTDFGCYGANMATWYLQGQPPLSVSCVTQQIKPELYPNVEDDATIILTYPTAQVIIQASWNWSHNRKEMEMYGRTGYVFCRNGTDMDVMESEEAGAEAHSAPPLPYGQHDPFALLNAVVKGEHQLSHWDLSGPANNERVMQILEAAKVAAETGKTVIWQDLYPES